MTKRELMVQMVKDSDGELTVVALEKMFRQLETTVKNELSHGDEIKILQGLSLVPVYKEPHEARNPLTGEKFMTKGKYKVKAKISKAFEDAANGIE